MLPRPLAIFKGFTSKGIEVKGRGRKGKGEGWGDEEEGGICPTHIFLVRRPLRLRAWQSLSPTLLFIDLLK